MNTTTGLGMIWKERLDIQSNLIPIQLQFNFNPTSIQLQHNSNTTNFNTTLTQCRSNADSIRFDILTHKDDQSQSFSRLGWDWVKRRRARRSWTWIGTRKQVEDIRRWGWSEDTRSSNESSPQDNQYHDVGKERQSKPFVRFYVGALTKQRALQKLITHCRD